MVLFLALLRKKVGQNSTIKSARCLAILLLLAVVTTLCGQVQIRMMAGAWQGIPPKEASDPRSRARRAVFEEFHRLNPDVQVVNAGGLDLPGDLQENGFLLSMAGDNAPDVFYISFRQYYNYIEQGFCRPLDDLVTADPSAIERANPEVMKVIRSYDDHIYAIPWFQVAMALYYRKDHFQEAGLDPSKPPQTWDEFLADARKLTQAAPGRTGFGFSAGQGSRAYHWVNFVWQAGGEIVEPAENGAWKSAIASPQAATALDFYRRLVAEKWQADGKTYGPAASISSTFGQDIADGKISMWLGYTNDVVLNMADLNPALLGVAQLPAGPAGRRNEINAGMWAINASIKDPKRLDACWRFIKFFSGEAAARVSTQRFVELGLGPLVNPQWLEKFGYKDQLAYVDPGFVEANKEVFKTGHPEPYGRNCQQVYVIADQALDRAVLEPNTPALSILQGVAKDMDKSLLDYEPPAVVQARRRTAGFVFAIVGLLTLAGVVATLRKAASSVAIIDERLPAGTDRKKAKLFLTFCVGPAALSILLWAYYPLMRGLVIAFQDYRIMRPPHFVGLDNFIAVFTQPVFYQSVLNSCIYVALTLLIGFFLPIFLALALNEIPKFNALYRVVFYLPAMTSPAVIALMFKQFYDKSPDGILNLILLPLIKLVNPVLGLLHLPGFDLAHNWLGEPNLARLAVVLPGIWAGAGPGSILYLAALKTIPEERYEAADLDGASWRQKIRFFTLPGLRPLILINLLGVFVGGFKSMESVLMLTNGGPLNATRTIGLEIWSNAFLFLRFGYATAAAWVLGAILLGFTAMQVQNLLKLRFRAAG
ncbi:MAG: extracellular solute-binding protein [Armatimonadetes bacterium]|nr:extracellular solute-binding protein [Armatimonadota bacterium]